MFRLADVAKVEPVETHEVLPELPDKIWDNILELVMVATPADDNERFDWWVPGQSQESRRDILLVSKKFYVGPIKSFVLA